MKEEKQREKRIAFRIYNLSREESIPYFFVDKHNEPFSIQRYGDIISFKTSRVREEVYLYNKPKIKIFRSRQYKYV